MQKTNNFTWDAQIWAEYVNAESLYRDSFFGEVNGDYVGIIGIDNYVSTVKLAEYKTLQEKQKIQNKLAV